MINSLKQELCYLKDISSNLKIDITDEEKEIKLDLQKSQDFYQIEKKLEDLSMDIRKRWINKNSNHVSSFLKSPDLLITPTTLLNTEYYFTYERDLDTVSLEQKIEENSIKERWNNCSLIFSSGMATINSLLNSLLSFYTPSEENPMKMICFADYFESRGFLEIISRSHLDIEYTNSSQIDINSYDLFYIESTKYDWDLSSFDVNQICNSSEEGKNNSYKFIIVDTTLSRNSIILDNLLDKVSKHPFVIVFEVSSGLKLDQFGLEFCNMGYLNIFCRKEDEDIIDSVKLKSYIKRVRTITGTALPFESASLLDNPLIFDKNKTMEYRDTIFENNLSLKNNITEGRLFKKVSTADQGSPFVVFQIDNNNLEDYGYLMGIISDQVKEIGASFYRGSSFGFRHHRYETIIPNIKIAKGLFKIAMGFRKGPTYNFILNLMNELSTYKNIEDLKMKYPDINPITFDHID